MSTSMTEKDIILETIQELPADTCIEEAMERLFLRYKVEKGLKQVKNGEMVSNDDAKARLQKWSK